MKAETQVAWLPTGSIFSSKSEYGSERRASRDRAVTAGMLGSRGLRSDSAPTRPVGARPESPPPPLMVPMAPPLMVSKAPPGRCVRAWIGPLTGVALGWLIASSLAGGFGLERQGLGPLLQQVLVGAAIVVFLRILRRRRAARAQPAPKTLATPSVAAKPAPLAAPSEHPGSDSSLDQGLRDIRRADPKFDPARFIGYIEMVFRSIHNARISRDVGSLRDSVTPQLYGELRAQAKRLQSLGHASHVEQIEIQAVVTEAWHENGQDYVTAYIDGSMLDHTVDEVTGALVEGSNTVPKAVDAFLTFTRATGLNPWMLSAIQTTS
jgi:predicted lipid-binding transport protein (Tim44 family)